LYTHITLRKSLFVPTTILKRLLVDLSFWIFYSLKKQQAFFLYLFHLSIDYYDKALHLAKLPVFYILYSLQMVLLCYKLFTRISFTFSLE